MIMKNLSFYLKIYLKIVVQDIKSKMSYRADFIISTIGMILTNVSGFVAFYVIFNNFVAIGKWSYYELLFFYGFSLVALTPVQCLFDNNWNLRSYVYNGDFIKYCFRPINIFFYFQSEIFDVKGIGQFVFGMLTIIYSWSKLGIETTVLEIIKLVIFLITASLFMIGIMNIAAATCFWLLYSGYIMVIASKLKDYARYPTTIFNPFFRFIFTFIIPIAFISFYPSLVILRPDETPVISWLSPFLGVIFFYISYKIWMIGATKYSGTGS